MPVQEQVEITVVVNVADDGVWAFSYARAAKPSVASAKVPFPRLM
ncbi:MAG TPA: hypothetical protein PK640_12600 [Verrucomicrobiota bacterium]|nr:hypothetical protein [Verrucomicrobiota bacterium]